MLWRTGLEPAFTTPSCWDHSRNLDCTHPFIQLIFTESSKYQILGHKDGELSSMISAPQLDGMRLSDNKQKSNVGLCAQASACLPLLSDGFIMRAGRRRSPLKYAWGIFVILALPLWKLKESCRWKRMRLELFWVWKKRSIHPCWNLAHPGC